MKGCEKLKGGSEKPREDRNEHRWNSYYTYNATKLNTPLEGQKIDVMRLTMARLIELSYSNKILVIHFSV